MVRAATDEVGGRSRPGALGVALALAALSVLVLQPLAHIALLRALLQAAGPGYSIICTVDGPRLIGDSERGAVASGDFTPQTRRERPLPDCCLGGGMAMTSPVVEAASFGADTIVIAEARPVPPSPPFASPPTWRLPRPRGPPGAIV